MKKVKISLQATEGQIFETAGQIYAAYVAAGKIMGGQEQQWMDRAAREAIQLAQLIDQLVQSDNELD